MRWLAILVVALVLVAAGCGGGSDSSTAADETTTEETTTSSESTSTEETTTADGTDTTDLSGVLGDEDCLALAGVGASIAQAFAGAADSGDQADLDALASKVPDEIKGDVETLAKGLAAYSAKVEDIGLTPGSTPNAEQLQQLQAAIASLDQAELTTASQNIEAWSKANCQS